MIGFKCLVFIFFMLMISAGNQKEVNAQSLNSIIAQLLNFFNQPLPIAPYRDQVENSNRELSDHSNDDIFSASTQEILTRSGYQYENYIVISKDGYKTEIIRIVNPLADRTKLKQPPIMLFHGGLIDTSAYVWASAIQHHPEKYPRTSADGPITSYNRSIGFVLSNNGYDVFLVGTRGANRRNLGHTTLKSKYLEDILANLSDPNSAQEFIDTLKYFDYSQDQLVDYEFPAQIDRVLEITNSTKVSTLTYSLSTHVMFKILALNNEYSKKIYTNVALAPLLNNIGANTFWHTLELASLAIPEDVGNLLFTQLLLNSQTRAIVRELPRYTIVHALFNLLLGNSPRYQTWFEDPVLGHTLLPLSFTELKHYCQQAVLGVLQKYDYGIVKNLQIYGQATPPQYNITQIRLKRYMLVAGDSDVLGTLNSADLYSQIIPAKPDTYLRFTNGWNHYDHAASFNVDTKVNLPILAFYDKFSSLDKNAIDLAD